MHLDDCPYDFNSVCSKAISSPNLKQLNFKLRDTEKLSLKKVFEILNKKDASIFRFTQRVNIWANQLKFDINNPKAFNSVQLGFNFNKNEGEMKMKF